MTADDPLHTLEDCVRRSALDESYRSTAALLDRYLCAVERRLKESPGELPALRERTVRLLEWTTRVVQANREEAAAQSSHLKALSRYGSPEAAAQLIAQG